MVHDLRISKSKLHGAEKREECAARVDVFEPLPGLQGRCAASKDDVFAEWRAVFDPDAEVLADGVMNGRLEEEKFERLGPFETEKVEIGETSKFGSDVEIGAGVGEEDAGIHKIGLAFLFAGPK